MEEVPAENAARIAEVLDRQGYVVIVPVGKSMWPMIRNRKTHVVIEKFERPLKKYDIPMYRRPGPHNKYVLHRIIKVKKTGGYVICGDNLWKKEYDVTDDMIAGVAKAFYNGEKLIDCATDRGYHFYVYIWRFLYPLRACFLWGRMQVGRMKRKIFKNKNQKKEQGKK